MSFAMYKENIDTMKAIGIVSDAVHVNSRSFSYAGNKDKRAITTQVHTQTHTRTLF